MWRPGLGAVALVLASSARCGAAALLPPRSPAAVQVDSVVAGDPAEEDSEDAGSLPSFDLMIIVPSHGRLDIDRRMAIRDSWGQYLNASVNCTPCHNRSVKTLFVVGKEGDQKAMAAEAERWGDLGVLKDFGQFRYGAGSAEKTQRSIRYALEHFKFRLLLKVDMDSWVFVDRLIAFLERRQLFDCNASMPGVYGGNFDAAHNVAVVELGGDPEGATRRMSPPHAQGAGYLLTPDLCEFIAGMGARSEDMSGAPKWGDEYGWAPVPRLLSLPSEDSSVGLWLAPVNHTELQMPVSAKNVACTEAEDARVNATELLIDRYVQPSEMRRRWRSFVETGDPCAKQRVLRAWHHRSARFLSQTG